MKDISSIIRSIGYALKGLRHAYRVDKSFRMEVMYGIPLYLLLGLLFYPMAPWEFVLLILSYLLLLTVELVNTAFEKMLDRIHPEDHELIGKSKDIASGAVLITLIFAVVVVVTIGYVHFVAHPTFTLGGEFA